MVYSTPVKNLRGVGEAKEKALAKLGIRCAGDILRHYPRAYQNRAAVPRKRSTSEIVPYPSGCFGFLHSYKCRCRCETGHLRWILSFLTGYFWIK